MSEANQEEKLDKLVNFVESEEAAHYREVSYNKGVRDGEMNITAPVFLALGAFALREVASEINKRLLKE
jgi:hypothetical protein